VAVGVLEEFPLRSSVQLCGFTPGCRAMTVPDGDDRLQASCDVGTSPYDVRWRTATATGGLRHRLAKLPQLILTSSPAAVWLPRLAAQGYLWPAELWATFLR